MRVHLEIVEEPAARFAGFLDLAVDQPDAPADLAAQHNHYLADALTADDHFRQAGFRAVLLDEP